MTYTAETVLEVLREVVQDKGADYVYPDSEKKGGSCVYAHNDAPSCIVGHVVYRLDPEAFKGLAEAEQATLGSRQVDELVYMDWLPDDFWDEDAQRILMEAQFSQDKGYSWGDALGEAEDAV